MKKSMEGNTRELQNKANSIEDQRGQIKSMLDQARKDHIDYDLRDKSNRKLGRQIARLNQSMDPSLKGKIFIDKLTLKDLKKSYKKEELHQDDLPLLTVGNLPLIDSI